MSSRQIVEDGENVRKIIPDFDFLNGKIFSQEFDAEEIYDLIEGASLLCKSAVIQQYNELLIYQKWSRKTPLAPLIDWDYDSRNLPVLIFPKFLPIVPDEKFYTLADEENYIELGRVGAQYGYSLQDIRVFLNEVRDVCDEFGLVEDDIFYNLSNIGANKQYGLRVIDYGFVDGINPKVPFELVEV